MHIKFFNRNLAQTTKSKIADLLKPRKKGRKIWKLLLLFSIYAILTLCFVVAFSFAWFSKDLPTPTKIASRKPTVSTKIYDRTGEIMLYETGDQKRTIVASDQISTYLKDATVATEDTNFYRHHGVDTKAILSAIFEKVTGRRRVARGGSTITQQYVKNALLTSDRSLVRKAKEAILAVELEYMFKKDQILTMYLNEIPYGNATAGAEAAARTYYGKPAKDLTLAEAATLAAIPKAPTFYSPYGTHVDKLIIRRDYVLDQMVKTGKITGAEAEAAKKEDTTTLGLALKPRRDTMLAPHFAMYVLEQVANEYGEEKIQKQGLKIITTLDYNKQKIAEQSISDGIAKVNKYGGKNAALVAIDPKTGQILSMIGSKDYFDVSIDGNVNVADSLRQPGSSFKPFAYATAFKKPEFSPSKILYDITTDFGNYTPHDYDGKNRGPVTIRQSLSNSLNIPAVKIMGLAGIDNVLRTASDMGITTLTQRDRYGLSLVLGSGEVKPVEMAGAYSVFATGGIKRDVTPILKITDANGKEIYNYERNQPKEKQVLDPQIAYEISSILSDNNSRSLVFGTRTQLYFPDRTVAVKTGTTNDFKDAWTMGYTPSLAVAVWTGNNDSKPMSNGADGSIVAAPIFHQFVAKALADVPNEEFARPAQIKDVTVEKYSNKLPSEYSQETVTDIFADWQIPKDQDDVHKVYKVCKGTNLIAPDGTNESYVENRVVTNIHSEKPNNPDWENPVIAWAQANGMSSVTPSGSCEVATFAPVVKITSPGNSQNLSGTSSIHADIQSAYSINTVEFLIDGQHIATVPAPYTIDYNFSDLSPGSHKLSAVATDEHGITGRDEIPIIINSVTKPKISNVAVTFLTSAKTATAKIAWTTNKDAKNVVTITPTGGQPITKESSTGISNSVSFLGLTLGTEYSLSIVATANDGSGTDTYNGQFVTPLNSEQSSSASIKI